MIKSNCVECLLKDVPDGYTVWLEARVNAAEYRKLPGLFDDKIYLEDKATERVKAVAPDELVWRQKTLIELLKIEEDER